jgi:ribosome-binding protein aMBF1 (putative translation factor)
MQSFGEIIRCAREQEGLLLRQVSAQVGIDLGILSKLERDERTPTQEQVKRFSKFYRLNLESLMVAWCSDKVASELVKYKYHERILIVAEKKLKGYKKKTGGNT